MNCARILLAGALDADAVMAVMDAAFDPAFGEAWTRGQLLGMLALPDVWLLLATPPGDGAAAGFALARRAVDEAELLLIAVHPEHRRHGIGGALIARTAREAQARGARRLTLEVRADNPALALYAATGFAQIGRRRDYYRGRDGRQTDALTLARDLDRESIADGL